eukprot:Nk52_evm55s230 gene=Nk52_evmTU55s230
MNQEEIISKFKEITGITDDGFCRSILESCGWSLESGIGIVSDPMDGASVPFEAPVANNQAVTESDDLAVTGMGLSEAVSNELRTSAGDQYSFALHYVDSDHRFSLRKNATVADLKQKVVSLTSVMPNEQTLFGWPRDEPPRDNQALSNLGFGDSRVNELILFRDETAEVNNSFNAISSGRNSDNSEDEEQEYFSPAGSGESAESESDSDDTDFFHSDDDMGSDVFEVESDAQTSGMDKIPMIAETMTDETSGTVAFSSSFDYRYGPIHIPFFQGTLQSAIKEARSDCKFVLIYLHCDGGLETPLFCSHVLCSEDLSAIVNENFIVWAWDVTSRTQRARALNFIKSRIDPMFQDNLSAETFPFLMILANTEGRPTMVKKQEGFLSIEELVVLLTEVTQSHKDELYRIREQDIAMERERRAREDIKTEQDRAYKESLEADKRKALEKEREQREEEERLLEEAKLKEEAEEKLRQLAVSIPDEPDSSCTEKVSKLLFRFPNGEKKERKFLASCQLETIFAYVASQGFDIEEHDLILNFPKRFLKKMPPGESLEKNGLFPAETIFVQEE